MTRFKVDVSDLLEFADDLEAATQATDNEIRRAMTQALDVLESAIVQRTPVNFGTLRAGTMKETRSMGSLLRGLVVNPTSYAWPVETGRKAGKMPPIAPIQQWVIRKGIASGAEASSVAYLIARAIGRRGTRGHFMFDKGFDAAAPTIIRIFSQVPNRILARLAK